MIYQRFFCCFIFMYIKQVIIKGFKTYGPQVKIDQFHRGCNAIVGYNGAGKNTLETSVVFKKRFQSFVYKIVRLKKSVFKK
jgi:chromosome segregation ATPase